MPAAVVAAMAALQMMGRGEDDATKFIVVKVCGVSECSDFLTNQCEDLRRVIQVARVTGECGKAAATETR